MNDLPRIVDEESLKAWFEGRPRADAVLVAHRAAMRVAPLWISAMRSDWARKGDLTAIPVLRQVLTSGVARKYSTPEVSSASAATSAFAATAATAASADATATAAFASADASAFAATAAFAAFAATAAFAASSAYASAFAATATAARSVVWQAIEADVHLLIENGDPPDVRLWTDSNPLADEWDRSIAVLQETPGGSFWIDWYQRALDGRPQNWPLLRDVALIDNALWEQGGEALDRKIASLVEEHRSADAASGPPNSGNTGEASADWSIEQPDELNAAIDDALSQLPRPEKATVDAIKKAVSRNRKLLPGSFDALEGLLLIELDRLRQKNFVDEDLRHQIRVMLTLYELVQRIRAAIPDDGEPTEQQAVQVNSLWSVYRGKFPQWARDKSDEVVDGVCTGALVLGTTALGSLLGLPATAGVAIGALVFARDRAGDIIKAAKDSLSQSGS